MTRWQYAWLTDQPVTLMGFSHPQHGLASELATVLGPGVLLQQSTEWSIALDRMRVNLGYVSGLMGDRGWEMFAVETRLQPGAMSPAQLQTNWYFKRPAAEVHTASAYPSQQAATPLSSGSSGRSGSTEPTVSSAASPATSDQQGVGFASINPNYPGTESTGGTPFPPPPGAPSSSSGG